jgi:hypothetical protein
VLPNDEMKARLRAIGWTDQKIDWFTQVYASRWTKRTWNRYLDTMERNHRIQADVIERARNNPTLRTWREACSAT